MTKKHKQNSKATVQDANKDAHQNVNSEATNPESQPATKSETKSESKSATNPTMQADLQAQLEQAQKSAKENWDKVLRTQADIENLKRRHTRDLENAHKFGLDRFVKALLEVKDSLTMGLKSASEENATIAHIIKGIEMTDSVFIATLAKFGVESINPENVAFNPELHEAVTMVPMPDKTSGNVLEVVQIGFTLNGRLVRPAMVIVIQ